MGIGMREVLKIPNWREAVFDHEKTVTITWGNFRKMHIMDMVNITMHLEKLKRDIGKKASLFSNGLPFTEMDTAPEDSWGAEVIKC